jgi:hypothetical protein
VYFYLLMRQYHYKYILGDRKPNSGGVDRNAAGGREGGTDGGGGGSW